MIKSKTVSNAAWIISCRIIQMLLSVIIGMLTARYLGPSKYGLISYAASLTAFFLPIMQLGLNSILVQELINQPKEEGMILGTAITMSFLSSLLCILGIAVFSFVANAGEIETTLVCVLYSTILIFQAVELLRYWFQAKLLSKYTSIVALVAYIIISIYRIVLLVSKSNIYLFALVNSLDSVIIAVSLLFIYKRLGGKKLKFSFDRAKEMFGRSRYFIMSSLMITFFAETDKIMLKFYLGEEYTGFYTAAVTCASYLGFVFTAILDSARPSILTEKKNKQSLFEKKIINLYSVVVYLSIGQCVLMTIFSDEIVNILYGEAYSLSSKILKLVVWFTTFSYIGGVRSIWILGENKQKYLWIIHMCGALANVIMNAVLIPIYGVYGAASASIITQIFINVIIGFVIPDIRRSNWLLFRSLNPKILISLLKGK